MGYLKRYFTSVKTRIVLVIASVFALTTLTLLFVEPILAIFILGLGILLIMVLLFAVMVQAEALQRLSLRQQDKLSGSLQSLVSDSARLYDRVKALPTSEELSRRFDECLSKADIGLETLQETAEQNRTSISELVATTSAATTRSRDEIVTFSLNAVRLLGVAAPQVRTLPDGSVAKRICELILEARPQDILEIGTSGSTGWLISLLAPLHNRPTLTSVETDTFNRQRADAILCDIFKANNHRFLSQASVEEYNDRHYQLAFINLDTFSPTDFNLIATRINERSTPVSKRVLVYGGDFDTRRNFAAKLLADAPSSMMVLGPGEVSFLELHLMEGMS